MSSVKRDGSVQDGQISRYRDSVASSATAPTWAAIPADTLVGLVVLATAAGDMVSFSYASEGAQLLLTVYSSGVRDRIFWTDPVEATKDLQGMIEVLARYVRDAGSKDEKRRAGGYLD